MKRAIECWSITKYYKELPAVKEINLTIDEGQLFGLLGPNGAGKSTLIKILTGLVHPTTGWAQIMGYAPNNLVVKKQIGYLPELFRYPKWMTANEILMLHCKLLEIDYNESKRQIDEVLSLTGLQKARNKKIGSYSKGMQQRIGLAQAIIGKPKILFLDEPASALDPVGRVQIRNLMQTFCENGTTIFLNSHLLSDIERICNKVAIINNGKVIFEGKLNELSSGLSVLVRISKPTNKLISKIEKRFGKVQPQNNLNEFRIISSNRELVPDIAKFLIDEGCKIYELRIEEDSLEEAFLKIIDKPYFDKSGDELHRTSMKTTMSKTNKETIS